MTSSSIVSFIVSNVGHIKFKGAKDLWRVGRIRTAMAGEGGSGSKSIVLSSFLSSTRSTVGLSRLSVRHLHFTHLTSPSPSPTL